MFNIYEAYIKEQNLMIEDDLNSQMDSILETVKNVLISNTGEVVGKEEVKMRICYPTVTNESKYNKIYI